MEPKERKEDGAMKETLTIGDRGRAVRELNGGLRALGYEAGAGDRFTQSTARGLCALQTDRGLEPTGQGDGRTRSLLTLLSCNDPEEAFYGDADGDGQLTLKDVGLVLKSLLTRRTAPTVALDADGSGKVDWQDARYLVKCLIGRAAPKPNAPWIGPDAGVGTHARRAIDQALRGVTPLRRQLVEAALPFACDPHGAQVAAFPRSLYLWGADLFGADKALYCPTSAAIELMAARKPAFFDGGRREMMLSALQNAASLGDRLSAADCSGAIVGLWRKFDLVEGTFDAVANQLLRAPLSFPIQKEDLLPGDLVGFDGHIGLYVGASRVVEWAGGAYGCQLTRLEGRCCWSFTEKRLVKMKKDFELFTRPFFLVDGETETGYTK